MKLKMKLTSTILAFCIVFSMLIVGVFSTQNASVSMSGSLTFTANGVYAKVTANYSNDGSTTTKIGEKTFDSSNQGTEEWKDKNIAFNSDGHDVVLTINIQNLATDRDLYAKVIDNSGTITNINKTLAKDLSTYTSGKEVTIAKGGTNTTTITITFGLADKNTSLSDATYSYAIELNNESVGDTVAETGYTLKVNYLGTTNTFSTSATSRRITGNPTSDLTYSVNGGEEQSYTSEAEFELQNVLTIKIFTHVTYARAEYVVWLSSAGKETYKDLNYSGTPAEFELTQNDTLNVQFLTDA
jgi:hypothetical protein